jgi:hypothetical protein
MRLKVRTSYKKEQNMVKKALQAGIAQVVEMVKVKQERERRLLIYFTDKEGQKKILGEEKAPDEPSRFLVEKDQKVKLVVQALIRQAMPCFTELDMELQLEKVITRGNPERFVLDGIELDLVRIGIDQVIGIPDDVDTEDLLIKSGFILIPLSEHPRKEKLIPKIGRP